VGKTLGWVEQYKGGNVEEANDDKKKLQGVRKKWGIRVYHCDPLGVYSRPSMNGNRNER